MAAKKGVDYSVPDRVSAALMARILGINRSALQKWACPKNADGTYSAPNVIAWKLEFERAKAREEGAAAAKEEKGESDALDRWQEARAQQAELSLAERLRKLARVEEVEAEWARFIGMLNTRLQGLPQGLAAKLEGLIAAEIAVELERAIVAAVEGVRGEYEGARDAEAGADD